jgi:2-polyprenyl-6-methoxyphenol hydroxylase-like FAD-dependent oxidoreductase
VFVMKEPYREVLVVGAGPTGLLLALVLKRLGVDVRILDKSEGPGTTSRALVLQARTLEFYRQLGIAEEAIRRGLVLGAVNLWRRDEHAARIELAEVGKGEGPYPFGLIFPQDEHERFLLERLAELGVSVERRTEVTALSLHADHVKVHERSPRGEANVTEAAFVAGCDGARSIVREAIDVEFPGGTYEHRFYVADVEARGAPMDHELHIILDHAGFLGIFPLAGEGRARLVGTLKDVRVDSSRAFEWSDIDRRPIEGIGLEVSRVNWFSTYQVHHRVAGAFRRGRVFLLGDAAHVHSPVGGQGMNTGLGDAMNLAWKIGAVLGGRAHHDVLDTYETERIAFARRLVATTDRVFQAASSHGKLSEVIRTDVVPWLLPRLARTEKGRQTFFRILSQIGIDYRASAWSQGHAGLIHAGDRLAWVEHAALGGGDNFEPLRSLEWQLHAYADPSPELRTLARDRQVPTVVFPFSEGATRRGFRRDALYLVRPDGYLGAVCEGEGAASQLEAYLDLHGVRGANRSMAPP